MSPGDRLLDGIARAADEHGPDAVVVGLPLNMDGTEGPRTKLVRAFAARIGDRLGLPVEFEDERLSSASADWSMARTGLTRGQKKSRRDSMAAAAILRTFFAGRGGAG